MSKPLKTQTPMERAESLASQGRTTAQDAILLRALSQSAAPPPPTREELPLAGRAMAFLFYEWPFGWLTPEQALLSQRGLIVKGITDEATGVSLDGYWALAGHLEWAQSIVTLWRIEHALGAGK